MRIKRKTMIFHRDWLDVVLGLRESEQLETLLAILEYGLTGERPDFISAQTNEILDFAQDKIERDYNRFVEYIKTHPLNKK